MQKILGYVRVSTKDQNVDRQLAAMRDMRIPAENIFVDFISGKNFQRPKYRQLMRKLDKGVILYIQSIDRLGRNYQEIIAEWRHITKDKGADIVVLDMPLLDTRRGKDLMGTFLSDIVLQVLSFVAENERSAIRKRQAEGIVEAKKRGVHFGRPRKPLPKGFETQCQKWIDGEITLSEGARQCGMPLSTFALKAKKRRDENLL